MESMNTLSDREETFHVNEIKMIFNCVNLINLRG